MKKYVLKANLEYNIPTPATLNLNANLTNKPDELELKLFGSYCIVIFWANDYADACRIAIKDLFPPVVSLVEIIDLIEDVTVQPRRILTELEGKQQFVCLN